MKKDIHPKYEPVVVLDTACGFKFLTRSTKVPDEKIEWEDGKMYPVLKVEISSASHPFFTGERRIIDAEGRVERFRKRYAKTKEVQDAKEAKDAQAKADGEQS